MRRISQKAREGKREKYSSSATKVSRDDLMHLKAGLEGAGTNCPLDSIVADADFKPCTFDVNQLPSRQAMLNAKTDILVSVGVRKEVMKKLTGDTDFNVLPNDEECRRFVKEKLELDHDKATPVSKATALNGVCRGDSD